MSGAPKLELLTTAELVEEQRRGTLVLDARPAEQVAALHIRGSIQISLMGNFASWAAILVKPTQKLALVADNVQDVEEAHTRLIRVGLGSVIGYSLAGEAQWHRSCQHFGTPVCECSPNLGAGSVRAAHRCAQPGRMAERTPAGCHLAAFARPRSEKTSH